MLRRKNRPAGTTGTSTVCAGPEVCADRSNSNDQTEGKNESQRKTRHSVRHPWGRPSVRRRRARLCAGIAHGRGALSRSHHRQRFTKRHDHQPVRLLDHHAGGPRQRGPCQPAHQRHQQPPCAALWRKPWRYGLWRLERVDGDRGATDGDRGERFDERISAACHQYERRTERDDPKPQRQRIAGISVRPGGRGGRQGELQRRAGAPAGGQRRILLF